MRSIFSQFKLPRETIKLSSVSSAIISHKTPDGHLSKTGYVKLSAFSQVLQISLLYMEAIILTLLQQEFY